MEKIKVVHPITRLILGGAQQNTMETCLGLNRDRFEPILFAGPETGMEGDLISEVRRRGVPLAVIPELVRNIDKKKDFQALVRMTAYLRAEKPHIVHTHSSKAGILGRWAARLAGVPIIVHTVHGWGHHSYQSKTYRSFFVVLERLSERISDKLVVVSDLNREKGLSDKIGRPDKYTTIHSCINLDEFTNVSVDVSSLKQQLGIAPDRFVIGTVGRLSPQKNPADFVRVAGLVKKKFPRTQFLFVGDGRLREDTERQVREAGLSEDIVLTGLRRDIPELLQCMDLFILTSLWEGLPRVIPQAMTAGLPVVANGVDGVCEVIQDGENGFLIPPHNVDLMAERIGRLIENPELGKKMGARGRKTAESEFSLKVMIQKIEALYETLIAQKPARMERFSRSISRGRERGSALLSDLKSANRREPGTPAVPSASKPLRVLHVFKEYFPDKLGGVQEAIRQISRYTTGEGIRNTVLTVSADCRPPVLGFPEGKVVRARTLLDVFSTPISTDFYRLFAENARSHDVLHFHFPWPLAELSFLTAGIEKPSLVTYHSDIVRQKFLKQFYRPLFVRFLRKVDLIVPTSEHYLMSSVDLIPFRSKCRVIPLTTGCRRFAEPGEAVMREVAEKYGRDFLLFVGVLRYYKGLDFLLEAMQGIDRKLVVVGKGPEGQHLKQKAAELGLNQVVFAGSVDDTHLPAFYNLCRAFVFPSCERSEAFGLSLLEASSFAKPMISTELGTGTSLVNQHQETGLVVPPKDSVELHNALERLCGDEPLCRRYGRNAKQRSDEMFDYRVVGQQYLDLYRELGAVQAAKK